VQNTPYDTGCPFTKVWWGGRGHGGLPSCLLAYSLPTLLPARLEKKKQRKSKEKIDKLKRLRAWHHLYRPLSPTDHSQFKVISFHSECTVEIFSAPHFRSRQVGKPYQTKVSLGPSIRKYWFLPLLVHCGRKEQRTDVSLCLNMHSIPEEGSE
jgi:hypothetical protein